MPWTLIFREQETTVESGVSRTRSYYASYREIGPVDIGKAIEHFTDENPDKDLIAIIPGSHHPSLTPFS